ncbi:MAG: translocation/assembly module TamB domain-containing protein, partial [Planctomycetota bacterium]
VTGKVIFHPETEAGGGKVEFRELTGAIVDCGEARFDLSGEYDGFTGDDPFWADIVIRDLAASEVDPAEGPVGRAVRNIAEQFQPTGTMDMTVSLRRGATEEVDFSGVAYPTDLAIIYEEFPCQISQVRGRLEFDGQGIGRIMLNGRRGDGQVSIEGKALRQDARWMYDVTVRAEGVPLDDEVRAALPASYASVWDRLQPEGRISAVVHAWRTPDRRHHSDVTLIMRGQTALTYRAFPYRLEDVVGRVDVGGNRVVVDKAQPLHGERGPMRCTLYGEITGISHGPTVVDLTIGAYNMPLDATLFEALPDNDREMLESIDLAGVASKVDARVIKQPGEPLTYTIQADVEDVSLAVDLLPYPFTDGAGQVEITPDRIILKSLTGMQDTTEVAVSGQLYLGEQLGVDLEVQADQVTLDDELTGRLPTAVQDVLADF